MTEAFPHELLLDEPDRKARLLQWYYEKHHENRDYEQAKDSDRKLQFFRTQLEARNQPITLGVDLGCRAGVLASQMKQFGRWIGVDIDARALELAQQRGVTCRQMDFSIAINFKNDAFDAVMLTEVLEHLPYPQVTVSEVHRILRKQPSSVFMGSVPLDYHLHRRFAVMRGRRLTMDPTHLHSFSYRQLKTLLETYFEDVQFEPLRGTKVRHRWLPWDHFVRDIAWFAARPREHVAEMTIAITS